MPHSERRAADKVESFLFLNLEPSQQAEKREALNNSMAYEDFQREKWYTLVDDFRTFPIGQMVSEIPLLNQVCLA